MVRGKKFAGKVCVWAVLAAAALVPLLAKGQAAGGFQLNINPSQLVARVQAQVGFSDEEWSVVQPRLIRVVGLQTQLGKGSMGQLAGALRGRNRGAGGANGVNVNALVDQVFNNGQPSTVTTKQAELEAALADPNTPAQTILVKLMEYRQAVQQAQQQLTKAQAELQSVLTVRQEAMFVTLGYLD